MSWVAIRAYEQPLERWWHHYNSIFIKSVSQVTQIASYHTISKKKSYGTYRATTGSFAAAQIWLLWMRTFSAFYPKAASGSVNNRKVSILNRRGDSISRQTAWPNQVHKAGFMSWWWWWLNQVRITGSIKPTLCRPYSFPWFTSYCLPVVHNNTISAGSRLPVYQMLI